MECVLYIESDKPIELNRPAEVSISTSNESGQHVLTPLDFLAWTREYGDVKLQCYDAIGQAVTITVSMHVIYEIAFGPLPGDKPNG